MDRDRIDQLLDHMEMNMRTVRSYLAGNDLDERQVMCEI